MAMSREAFDIFVDALRTICRAYDIDLIKTSDCNDRVVFELIGFAIKRPRRNYPLAAYIENYEQASNLHMEFHLHAILDDIYGLLENTRTFFEDTLHLTTTSDINKLWEELLMKNFTKNDLKNGDFVIRRDGVKGVVVANTGVVVCWNGGYLNLHDFNADLSCDNSTFDIMKVYRGAKCFDLCEKFGILVYDRESVEVEEMTLEQVCKALGKNIKIVKG